MLDSKVGFGIKYGQDRERMKEELAISNSLAKTGSGILPGGIIEPTNERGANTLWRGTHSDTNSSIRQPTTMYSSKLSETTSAPALTRGRINGEISRASLLFYGSKADSRESRGDLAGVNNNQLQYRRSFTRPTALGNSVGVGGHGDGRITLGNLEKERQEYGAKKFLRDVYRQDLDRQMEQKNRQKIEDERKSKTHPLGQSYEQHKLSFWQSSMKTRPNRPEDIPLQKRCLVQNASTRVSQFEVPPERVTQALRNLQKSRVNPDTYYSYYNYNPKNANNTLLAAHEEQQHELSSQRSHFRTHDDLEKEDLSYQPEKAQVESNLAKNTNVSEEVTPAYNYGGECPTKPELPIVQGANNWHHQNAQIPTDNRNNVTNGSTRVDEYQAQEAHQYSIGRFPVQNAHHTENIYPPNRQGSNEQNVAYNSVGPVYPMINISPSGPLHPANPTRQQKPRLNPTNESMSPYIYPQFTQPLPPPPPPGYYYPHPFYPAPYQHPSVYAVHEDYPVSPHQPHSQLYEGMLQPNCPVGAEFPNKKTFSLEEIQEKVEDIRRQMGRDNCDTNYDSTTLNKLEQRRTKNPLKPSDSMLSDLDRLSEFVENKLSQKDVDFDELREGIFGRPNSFRTTDVNFDLKPIKDMINKAELANQIQINQRKKAVQAQKNKEEEEKIERKIQEHNRLQKLRMEISESNKMELARARHLNRQAVYKHLNSEDDNPPKSKTLRRSRERSRLLTQPAIPGDPHEICENPEKSLARKIGNKSNTTSHQKQKVSFEDTSGGGGDADYVNTFKVSQDSELSDSDYSYIKYIEEYNLRKPPSPPIPTLRLLSDEATLKGKLCHEFSKPRMFRSTPISNKNINRRIAIENGLQNKLAST